jgi:hypothetical protein
VPFSRAGQGRHTHKHRKKKKVSLKSEGMSNAAHKIPAARRTSSSRRLLACLWSQEVRRCGKKLYPGETLTDFVPVSQCTTSKNGSP